MQRGVLQQFFYPWDYNDREPSPQARLGEARPFESLEVDVSLHQIRLLLPFHRTVSFTHDSDGQSSKRSKGKSIAERKRGALLPPPLPLPCRLFVAMFAVVVWLCCALFRSIYPLFPAKISPFPRAGFYLAGITGPDALQYAHDHWPAGLHLTNVSQLGGR